MKPFNTLGTFALAALLLGGCGQAPSSSNATPKDTAASPPAAPSANPPTAAAPSTEGPAVSTVSPATTDTASASAQEAAPVSQFAAAAAKEPDKVAASIGSDLAAKANTLVQEAKASPEVRSQVSSALQSLTAGKYTTGLTALYDQAKQATLTPQQTQLLKDVNNLASAYVVQRNFSTLEGAQGDVANVVNSLRGGSITPAIHSLESLAQNTALTPQQKELLGTLADQYAPGIKKASAALKQGLQNIPGFGK